MPARVWRCVKERVVRFENARLAVLALGRVRRVGRVRVLSVYESPYFFCFILAWFLLGKWCDVMFLQRSIGVELDEELRGGAVRGDGGAYRV